ncbi:hypothetical protein H0H87_001710 [Tephrocybe sp. NHM501043]|nr:hypothetical protein H0H87_001710 [Tephrocybe sp. NHM501043]
MAQKSGANGKVRDITLSRSFSILYAPECVASATSDVDCSFFLVTVDLWSADGKEEMNLVLHPSSADRYVPPHSTKTRRRGTSSSAPHPRSSGNQTPISQSTPAPAPFRSGDQPTGISTQSAPSQSSNFNSQTYFPPMADAMNFPSPAPYSTTAPETPTWGYSAQSPSVDRNTTYPPPILPSIASFARAANSGTLAGGQDSWSSEQEPEALPYRAWGSDAQYQPADNFHAQVDPALRGPNSDGRDGSSSSWTQGPDRPPLPRPNLQQLLPLNRAIHTHAHSLVHYRPTHAVSLMSIESPGSSSCSKTYQSEPKASLSLLLMTVLEITLDYLGSFRLRLRLMNIGAPPAPEAGATCVHTGVSPVLAQTFTEPFVVYSAKRFPGVPDTTALSIAFGNQGQKLPLRNRHGSSKRRRRDESSDDDDSDEA